MRVRSSWSHEQRRKDHAPFLFAGDGNQRAEFYLLLKAWNLFEEVNAWNIEKCKENHWNVSLALCYLLQGWYRIKREAVSLAEKSLAQAEAILRPVRLPQELSRLDWAWGLLAEAKGNYEEGLQRVEDSLFICIDKGFRLQQADSLCLKGRLLLLRFKQEGKKDYDLVEKAADNGQKALKIADDSQYIWAKIEALELLCAYHQTRTQQPAGKPEKEKELSLRYSREAALLRSKVRASEKQLVNWGKPELDEDEWWDAINEEGEPDDLDGQLEDWEERYR